MLVRQLEEELRIRSLQNPGHEVRQQVEAMYAENDHLSREVAILRETVKVSEHDFFWCRTFSSLLNNKQLSLKSSYILNCVGT